MQTEIKEGEGLSHFKDEADGCNLLIPDTDIDLNGVASSPENWDGEKH